jgi:hypothetical protein
MEFPPEVVGLIKEFSQPRMRFVNEYKNVMRYLGMDDWYDVKRRLFDKDASQVIDALLAYKNEIAILETELDSEDFIIHVKRRNILFEELLSLLDDPWINEIDYDANFNANLTSNINLNLNLYLLLDTDTSSSTA